MTRKQKWLIGLTCFIGSVLMACDDGGTMAREEIDLQHLVTPAGLMVQNKEVYEMVQEIGNSGPGVAFEDLSQLEDEERQEIEAFFGQLPGQMLEIEERTVEIRDEATIDAIFDALRTASGEYVNADKDMASWLDGEFYYIRVAYEDEALNQRGYAMDYPEQLQDGYVFHLYVLEDERLFFSDGKMNDEGGKGLVTVPFDFQWFDGLIH
ncbi:hypothetical protein [Anoxynatronum buryatiense]|uniref:Uncharacterized protein n=1 Tax=Anoxynatronum buryatiense TaxID=489973 RepID=A0AA45WT93_9CLOT|nr:hypothetical protein [Anoxynatronum buryatiense]SMP41265.1 hypothetical protein SAMN06296020_101480 [Anoxynatronum buryatiense]